MSEPQGPPRPAAVLIASEHYRSHRYGANHPLPIPRVSLTLDLIRACEALDPQELIAGRCATREELRWHHTGDYLRALERAQAFGQVRSPDRIRHALGTLENPWFPGVYYTPALATGSSIQAAEAVLSGQRAFSPAGGMHHARPDRACGFCYLNDPVLAILRLRQGRRRVLYLDLDAHHGDGVEEAFAADPEVLTVSLHMDTAYAYPFSGGAVTDIGVVPGAGTCINVPLPQGTHDAEYRLVFEAVWNAAMRQFVPDVVVVQAGTDGLFADPLGRFALSTEGFLGIMAQVLREAPGLLVLGGGGYHPLLLARCWTGLWALLSGRALPDEWSPAAAQVLSGAGWDQDEDEPHYESLLKRRFDRLSPQAVRPEVLAILDKLQSHHPLLREMCG